MQSSLDSLLQIISTLPLWQKAIYVGACLVFFMALENIATAQQFAASSHYSHAKHIAKNLLFLLFSLIINSLFAALFISASQWSAATAVGLFSHINLSSGLQLLISLVVLDFVAQYLCHIVLHKTPWLWKLHTVHHNDFHVDLSTGSRHHPIDYCTRELAALACVVLLAMPVSHYLLYKLVSVFFTYFTHANFRLPRPLESILNKVFVTPDMHKVHHHQFLPLTDSNYGNILSIWDRLFGTLRYKDVADIEYGVDTDIKEKELAIAFQLRRPFLAKQLR